VRLGFGIPNWRMPALYVRERPAIATDLDASDAVIALTAEDRPM
jgi:hypothetical protein